jgi:hypothetical protein
VRRGLVGLLSLTFVLVAVVPAEPIAVTRATPDHLLVAPSTARPSASRVPDRTLCRFFVALLAVAILRAARRPKWLSAVGVARTPTAWWSGLVSFPDRAPPALTA